MVFHGYGACEMPADKADLTSILGLGKTLARGKGALRRLRYSRMWTQRKTHHADGLINLVAWGGIEPPTQGFSILCSTD